MTSEEILRKITVKFNMLQLMETNLVEVLERRQTTLKGLNFADFAEFAYFRENPRNLIPRKL